MSERFRIIPGCTYQLRGYPDQRKVAHVFQVGRDETYGRDHAYGVTCALSADGLVYDSCDWTIEGLFHPEEGEGSLDIVSAIGPHAPAEGSAMVPLHGPGGFQGRLQEIVDQSRNLRQGGASAEDLSGLEEGLERAVALADDLLSDLVWSPPTTSPVTWDNPDGPTAA